MATKAQRIAANLDRQKNELIYFPAADLIKNVHIDPSKNIRTDYDVETLARVILRDGEIFEPLEIRRADKLDKTKKPYVLGSDGNRRYFAAEWLVDHKKSNGILDVPCKVIAHRPTAIEATLKQLSTGSGRGKKLLHPLEEAQGYVILLAEGYTKDHKALAKKQDVTPQHIYARITLLNTRILHPLIETVGLNLCETLARVFVTPEEKPWLKKLVKLMVTIDKDGVVTKIPEGIALAADIANRHGTPARDAAMAKLKGADETDNPQKMWPDEALEFTPWLAGNLSTLGSILGLDLELRQREAPVVSYSLDILARDRGSDRQVAIENQLKPTDHTHLGQLLTYAAEYDAKVIVWIAREFRQAHKTALKFLNDNTSKDRQFFGVEVELRKIDDFVEGLLVVCDKRDRKVAQYAVIFNPVATPKEWREQTRSNTRGVGRSEKEVGLPTVKARLRPSKRPVKGTEHT